MAFDYTSIYTSAYGDIATYLGISITAVIIIMTIISVWTIIWKGLALWKSSRKGNLIWFIIFLLVNTVGILEILYIYVFSKMDLKESKKFKQKQSVKKVSKKIKKK